MAKLIDLINAKGKLQEILTLRDNLINATPLLNIINENLSWYEKAYNQIPIEHGENLLGMLDNSISAIVELNPATFSFNPLTAATGSFVAVSGDTRNIINVVGGAYSSLIVEYDQINAAEKQIGQAILLIEQVDSELASVLRVAKNTFEFWKGELRNNSDLAKDIRSFQDLFKGHLNKLRAKANGGKIPKEFSWPKMAEAIVKSGAGNLQNLKKQQKIHDDLHLVFTETFKGTRKGTKAEMEQYFKDYIEHVLVILSLIKADLLNP